jgi:nucleotide-binding universal stress UspA family protein
MKSEAPMVEIRRILCPTDFSDESRHALTHAIAIAGWYGAEVTALHIGNPMVVLSTIVPVPASMTHDPPHSTNRRRLETQVRNWLSPATAVAVPTSVAVDEGNPVSCILEHARSLPADLIVMGTHGRGGFERLVLGSVAEKVLRKAMCPVMTVPPTDVSTSKLPFEQIICPVDFSDSSIAALQYAFSLAQETNARLSLLHVVEWPSDEVPAGRVQHMAELRQLWEENARRRLEALVTDDVRSWCRPEPVLAFGKAYQQILNAAEIMHADLIVMGVHGRNSIDMMLFGSTTQHVVRKASCPVLTLRS